MTESAICHECKRPILDGEHRWARREPEENWHYACAERAGLTKEPNPFFRGKDWPRD